MKMIYFITCVLLFINMQSGAEQKVLNAPPAILSAEKSSFINELGSLISKKNIKSFYEETSKVVERFSISPVSNSSQQHLVDYFYLRYLVALAPIIDSNNYENIKWQSDHEHLDLRLKSRILKLMSPQVLNDDYFTKHYDLPRAECVDLYNKTQALIIKQFKSSFNPRMKSWEKQKRLHYSKNERLYATRDEAFAYFNAINITKLRNELMKNEIMHREKYFVKSLVQFYPRTASQAIKLMESAGFERKEMPGLIDRTEGRTEKTRYLYKNLPKNVSHKSSEKDAKE